MSGGATKQASTTKSAVMPPARKRESSRRAAKYRASSSETGSRYGIVYVMYFVAKHWKTTKTVTAQRTRNRRSLERGRCTSRRQSLLSAAGSDASDQGKSPAR